MGSIKVSTESAITRNCTNIREHYNGYEKQEINLLCHVVRPDNQDGLLLRESSVLSLKGKRLFQVEENS